MTTEATPQLSNLGQWARWYATDYEWRVLPLHNISDGRCTCGKVDCSSPGKHPRTPHGLNDAATDPKIIEGWWRQWPEANIGIRTGDLSAIVVVDIDPRHGGDKSLVNLIAEHGELPKTVTAATGGGGTHFIFKWPGEKITNRSDVLPGIDVRGDSGYIVATPSNHMSGSLYAWRDGCGPQDMKPVAMPPWLLELIRKPPTPKSDPTPEHNGDKSLLLQRAGQYADKAKAASDGARNNAAFALAGHLFGFQTTSGVRLGTPDVMALMSSWNSRNTPPLSADELAKVVASARDNGTPRTPHLVDSVEVDAASTIPTWRPFPTDALPEPVRGFCRHVAVAVGCDESFVALPALSMLASCIGNTRTIELNGTWTQPAAIWTGTVAESGDMKTPASGLVLKPLRAIAHDLYDANREAAERYDAALEDWKNRLKRRGAVSPARPKPPIAKRVIIGDTTIEALAPILLDNWRGVLLHEDELAAWFGGFDKYRKGIGGDSAKWNSIYSGEPITIDRKTGTHRSIYVPRPFVSISGNIPPATLARALTSEYQENGLAARFLFARPRRRIQKWTDVEVPEPIEAAFKHVVHRLRELRPGEDRAGRPYPVSLPLTPKALALFIAFVNQHGNEQFNLTGPLGAAWSKLKGYAARFALLFQCVRWAAGEAPLDVVDEVSVAAGIVLADWFGREAERLYAGFAESAEEAESRELMDWIRGKGGSVSVRDLLRGPRRFRSKKDEAQAALDELVEAGFGQWHTPPQAGRGHPTKLFVLTGDTGDGDTITPHDSASPISVAVATVATPENTPNTPGDDGPDDEWGEA